MGKIFCRIISMSDILVGKCQLSDGPFLHCLGYDGILTFALIDKNLSISFANSFASVYHPFSM